jgi:transcriptional regulator with XRE-family HTH domain
MPLNLSNQLAARVKRYCFDNNISQRRLAKKIGVDEGQFSAFLKGTVNMSAERTLQLLQLMNKPQLPRKAIHLEHFQTYGKPITLDDAENWTPGQEGSDPADGASIVDDGNSHSDADDYQAATQAFLKSQLALYRKGIRAIKSYLQNQNNKATVNQ